jgi:hypothetical protein
MTAKSRIVKTTTIEREIGEKARAAKLKLRFDKVVRRLTGDLKATLAGVLPEGQSVVITVTAPIRHPAKTAETLESIVRDGLAHGELCKTIHGNKVWVRPITHVATSMPKVLAFVHNTESDARLILDIAESRLLQRD